MLSNIVSDDTAIRCLADKRTALDGSLLATGLRLQAYAKLVMAPISQPMISPQEHYNMLDQANCGCVACTDWDLRRKEFYRATKLIPKGHKWTVCACGLCRFVGRFQLNLLAAANRRELMIEMSFHARYHSRHGGLVMDWLAREMTNPTYTVNWCAQEMSRYPMERWLQRCEMAVSGVAGGPIWVTSTMVTDMYTPFGSSLLADVDTSRWLQ